MPHRHHAAGTRKIRPRLDRPVTAPSPAPVFTAAHIPYEVAAQTRTIAPGGIGALPRLARKLGLAAALDERLHWLKDHRPCHKSDHVLNFASNAPCHGAGRDDSAPRRHDLVCRDALGADRIPEPTTGGDLGRRFSTADVETIQDVFDQTRLAVWREQHSDFFDQAVLDVDGTLVATGGCCTQGVDIASDGTWGYHPLLLTRAHTGAVLGIVTRSGNRPAHEGAAEPLDLAIPLGRDAGFRGSDRRGDTDFTPTQRRDACDAAGVTFRFGGDAMPHRTASAADRPASHWSELPRPPQDTARGKPQTRPERVQDRIVRDRGFATVTRVREDVAVVADRPTAGQESYRRVVVRPTSRVETGQWRWRDEVRDRCDLTHDRTGTGRELVFPAHDRCDQEHRIASRKGGADAPRAAVDHLVSHGASLVLTALAWDRKAWWARSVPEHPRHQAADREPKRVRLRRECTRFVNAIILMPCPSVRGGRRLVDRRLSWNEWQGVFPRVVPALRRGQDDRAQPGSGGPGSPRRPEPRGRRGGDEEGDQVVKDRGEAVPAIIVLTLTRNSPLGMRGQNLACLRIRAVPYCT